MHAVTRLRFAGSFAAIVLLVTGCVVRRPPETATIPGAAGFPGSTIPESVADVGADTRLGSILDAIFSDGALGPVVWSVEVRALPNETLYARNRQLLLTPASTMKVVTLAAAAERLGWDHRFETTLWAAGEIRRGTIEGDLVVRGTGDPTINAPGTENLFARWATELRSHGESRRIAGRIVGDDDVFDGGNARGGRLRPGCGLGMGRPGACFLRARRRAAAARERGGSGCGARRPALAVRPGSISTRSIDDPRFAPPTAWDPAQRSSDASPPGGEADIRLIRRPDGAALVVTGADSSWARRRSIRTGAVADPTLFFVQGLRAALWQAGIVVDGAAIDIDQFDPDGETDPASTIAATLATRIAAARQRSRSDLMKRSQNLYAESLLQHLGAISRRDRHDADPAVAAAVLEAWDIGRSQAIIADGSGLSRYNALSATGLLDVLARIWHDPQPP